MSSQKANKHSKKSQTATSTSTTNGTSSKQTPEDKSIGNAVDRYKMKSIQGMKVPSENRLKIYSMSHFLFGASDIDEKWLKIAVSIGMLKSAKYNPLRNITKNDFTSINIMYSAVCVFIKHMWREDTLHILMNTVEENKMSTLQDIRRVGKENHLIAQWKCYIDGPDDRVVFAIIWVCAHCYELVINKVSKEKLKCFEGIATEKEEGSAARKKGNDCFTDGDYNQAIVHYTNAVKINSYNHVIYGNRAQAYLNLGKDHLDHARLDALRAVVLQSLWPKGHYRLAEALGRLGLIDDSLKANGFGIQQCPEDKDLKRQLYGLTKMVMEIKFNYEGDEQDIPEMISSDEDAQLAVTKKLQAPKPRPTQPKVQTKTHVPSKVEEKVSKPKKRAIVNNDWEKSLQEHLLEGCTAYTTHLYKSCITHLTKAKTIVDEDGKRLSPKQQMLMIYILGMAHFKTEELTEISTAMQLFKTIIDTYSLSNTVLGYLGMGEALYRKNRFTEARDHLTKGLNILHRTYRDHTTSLCMPGTTIVIEDTKPGNLETNFKELKYRCMFPDKPLAICCFHGCCEKHQTTFIYENDLDLTGYVLMECLWKCSLKFHTDCWYQQRNISKKKSKELIGTPCITDGCRSVIVKIVIYDKNLEVKSNDYKSMKEKSPGARRPAHKQQRSSVRRIAYVKQYKLARKQKRMERKEKLEAENIAKEQKELQEKLDRETAHAIQHHTAEATHLLHTDEDDGWTQVILKQGDKNYDLRGQRSKPSKQQPYMKVSNKGKSKKKDHGKQNKTIMSLEEFIDTGMNNADEYMQPQYDGIVTYPEDINGDVVGPNLQAQIEQLNSYAANRAQSAPVEEHFPVEQDDITHSTNVREDITQGVLMLFIDVLQQHGPLHYRDARIQLELQNFPLSAQSIIRDAGGVSSFLLQSLKFAVKDEFVCLLTDAARARELSEDYKRNPLNYALMDDVINQQIYHENLDEQYPVLGSQPPSTQTTLENLSDCQSTPSMDTQSIPSSVSYSLYGGMTESVQTDRKSSVSDMNGLDDCSEDYVISEPTTMIEAEDNTLASNNIPAKYESIVNALPLVTRQYQGKESSPAPIGTPPMASPYSTPRVCTPTSSSNNNTQSLMPIGTPNSEHNNIGSATDSPLVKDVDRGLDNVNHSMNLGVICKGMPAEQVHNRLRSGTLFGAPLRDTSTTVSVSDSCASNDTDIFQTPPTGDIVPVDFSLPPPPIQKITGALSDLSPLAPSWQPNKTVPVPVPAPPPPAPPTHSLDSSSSPKLPNFIEDDNFPDVSEIWKSLPVVSSNNGWNDDISKNNSHDELLNQISPSAISASKEDYGTATEFWSTSDGSTVNQGPQVRNMAPNDRQPYKYGREQSRIDENKKIKDDEEMKRRENTYKEEIERQRSQIEQQKKQIEQQQRETAHLKTLLAEETVKSSDVVRIKQNMEQAHKDIVMLQDVNTTVMSERNHVLAQNKQILLDLEQVKKRAFTAEIYVLDEGKKKNINTLNRYIYDSRMNCIRYQQIIAIICYTKTNSSLFAVYKSASQQWRDHTVYYSELQKKTLSLHSANLEKLRSDVPLSMLDKLPSIEDIKAEPDKPIVEAQIKHLLTNIVQPALYKNQGFRSGKLNNLSALAAQVIYTLWNPRASFQTAARGQHTINGHVAPPPHINGPMSIPRQPNIPATRPRHLLPNGSGAVSVPGSSSSTSWPMQPKESDLSPGQSNTFDLGTQFNGAVNCLTSPIKPTGGIVEPRSGGTSIEQPSGSQSTNVTIQPAAPTTSVQSPNARPNSQHAQQPGMNRPVGLPPTVAQGSNPTPINKVVGSRPAEIRMPGSSAAQPNVKSTKGALDANAHTFSASALPIRNSNLSAAAAAFTPFSSNNHISHHHNNGIDKPPYVRHMAPMLNSGGSQRMPSASRPAMSAAVRPSSGVAQVPRLAQLSGVAQVPRQAQPSAPVSGVAQVPRQAQPSAPSTAAKMSSFDKIMNMLENMFPNLDKDYFQRYMTKLRMERNGSLAGLSLHQIVQRVADMIKSDYKTAKSGSQHNSAQHLADDLDPCAICHEEMKNSDVSTLECTHTFHTKCIRMWFLQQSTCPNCRVHSLLDQDYPSLQ